MQDVHVVVHEVNFAFHPLILLFNYVFPLEKIFGGVTHLIFKSVFKEL
jgi:hypothetical protein